ncbi:hypothetical protein A3849_20565 [Paenibacillus sp. P46E]|nr:hypothetical protein A3849_20565 [Paenibacillus sp. P46E]
MTSNDAPLGHATASSVWISGDGVAHHQPFKLFDGDMSDVIGWASSVNNNSGWIAYEFNKPVVVNQYALLPRPGIAQGDYKGETPKDFTFEAWNGSNWITLDSETNITDWKPNVKKVFTFTNEKPYTKFRLNIIKNNGLNSFTALGALEMYNIATVTPSPTATPVPSTTPVPTATPAPTSSPSPTATPTPKPTVAPEQPTGDRAILTITFVNGSEKEYELPIAEVDAFLTWYDNRDAGRGPGMYAIDKHTNNKGPFKKRKDYVVFDKILTYEVSEYTVAE